MYILVGTQPQADKDGDLAADLFKIDHDIAAG